VVDLFNVENESAVAFARGHAGELTRKWLLPDLSDGAVGKLRALVVQAVQEGWSGRQLGLELERVFGIFRALADVAGHTEIASAQENGTLVGWRESGVVRAKQWRMSSDHKASDACDRNAAAGEIPIDKPFPSGAMVPPAHAGCSCFVIAVTKS
jgi:hypothetical protein